MTYEKFTGLPTSVSQGNDDLSDAPRCLEETRPYDPELPQFRYIYPKLIQYIKENSKRKHSLARQIAHDIVTTPSRLVGIYQALAAIEFSEPEKAKSIAQLKQDFEKQLGNRAKELRPAPTKNQIGGFMEIAIKNPSFEKTARMILREFILGVKKTQSEIVDLIYNMCLYALESRDSEIEKFVAEISTFQTDIFPANSPQAAVFTTAMISLDDETLAKFLDIDHTTYLLRRIYMPQKEVHFAQAIEKITAESTFMQYASEAHRKNPERFAAIMAHYQREKDSSIFEVRPRRETSVAELSKPLPFPTSLVTQARPLRQAYRKRLAEYLKEIHPEATLETIGMPDGSQRSFLGNDQERRNGLRGILKTAYGEGEGRIVLEDLSISSALTYLKPPNLAEAAYCRLEELRASLKKELWDNILYTVSPRGDLIIVEDPRLNEAGVVSILFELGKNGIETKVTLTIGKYQIPLLLDPYFSLKKLDGKELAISRETRIWWEAIILSYLRDLLCHERRVVPEALKEKPEAEHEVIREKEFTARRGHRRLLPPGQKFTPEQYKRVKESPLRIDLIEYNVLHPGPDGRVYTWVLPKEEVRIGTLHKPIVSRIPNALKEVEEIVKVDELSI